jgi:lipooligosaccharide transport system permease protein
MTGRTSAALALRVVEGYARAYRRTWKGTAATTFVSPVLFLAAMGLGLGALVDRGQAAVPAESYLAFLAPGLLAATAMQTAATDTTWPVMAGIKWLKTYHAALATPVSTRDLVAGHLGWVLVRLTFASIVFAAVMLVFGVSSPPRAALAVVPAMLTGLAFGSLITAFTASAVAMMFSPLRFTMSIITSANCGLRFRRSAIRSSGPTWRAR